MARCWINTESDFFSNQTCRFVPKGQPIFEDDFPKGFVPTGDNYRLVTDDDEIEAEKPRRRGN